MLNVIGNQPAEESTNWESFKGAWRDAMAASAAEKGVLFSNQYGPPRPIGTPGTLVVVEVSDYRILDTGTRYGWGIMTGNAFLYMDAGSSTWRPASSCGTVPTEHHRPHGRASSRP